MDNVNVTDMDRSVEIGEANEKSIISAYVNWLSHKKTGAFKYFKMPHLSSIDYTITKGADVYANVEVKVRSQYFYLTMFPTKKELDALHDYLHKRIRTVYLAYYIDRRLLALYDLIRPPVKREWVERKDRGVSNFYSFFGNPINIPYRGDL